jgi:hypothetical protein
VIVTPRKNGMTRKDFLQAGQFLRADQARERHQLTHLGKPPGRSYLLARQAERLARCCPKIRVLDIQDCRSHGPGWQFLQGETAHGPGIGSPVHAD